MITLNTFTGHKNTDQLVADRLSDTELLNLCKADPDFYKDDNFWRDRLFKKYGVIEKSADKSWKTFYLQTVYYFDKSKNSVNIAMIFAAGAGHRDLVDFFIQQGASAWDDGICSAAYGGHLELVDFFIQQGANNWILGMLNAAEAGHEDLVKFFKQKMNL